MDFEWRMSWEAGKSETQAIHEARGWEEAEGWEEIVLFPLSRNDQNTPDGGKNKSTPGILNSNPVSLQGIFSVSSNKRILTIIFL